MPMRHVLALDQSPRKIGFAIGRRDMLTPITGVHELPAGRNGAHGPMLSHARDWLDTQIKVYHITKVCFETPFLPSIGGRATWAVMNKLIGVIELVCDDHEIKCVETTPDNWRRHFIGICRAPKDIQKTRRRAWLKERAMQACAARRWVVKTDDEAEAAGILSYVLSLDAGARDAA